MEKRSDAVGAMGAVLDWLGTPEAFGLASRRLRTAGFVGFEYLADDVLSEASVAVLVRARSTVPLEVDNPAAYGTTVVLNAIKRMGRGEVLYLEDLHLEQRTRSERRTSSERHIVEPPPPERGTADEFRVLLEHSDAPEWLRSAVLAYLCFMMFPDSAPEDAPAPRSGADPDQALAWPALWFSGRRDLFPADGADPHKRRRGRHIEKIRARFADVANRLIAREGPHG